MQILTPRPPSGRVVLLPVFLGLYLLVPSTGLARTWQILVDGSGSAPTVQAGIDSAAAGDTVLVHPGTYHERINYLGKNIVVRSAAGPEQTILDGTGLGGRVVMFQLGEGRAAVLRGFTVTGGAGGVLVHNAEPSIIDNLIVNNVAVQDGGGIWCDGRILDPPAWHPLIEGNRVLNNDAQNLGGGIGFLEDMVPEVLDNCVEGNEARDGDGGGIYYRNVDQGMAVIRGNTVINNRAGDHGGGIYLATANQLAMIEAEVSWNLIAGNVADGRELTGDSGGGIWLGRTNAWIHHNTLFRNAGNGPGNNYGGGIAIVRPGNPLIEKNLIANSVAGGGIRCNDVSAPTIRNNLAWQNAGGDGVGTCPTWSQSDGNIVDDPYFCDLAGGDYRVASNSGVMTHPAGPLGCFPIPGCGRVAVESTTWGRIKALYR